MVRKDLIGFNQMSAINLKLKQSFGKKTLGHKYFLLINFCIFYTFYTWLPTAYGDIVIYSETYILPLPWTMLYIFN
jgi:hypothetical protein